MWTRSLLKKNAWDNLRSYYWPALGVTVVAGMLGANGGGGGGYGGSSGFSSLSENMSSGSSSSGSDIDPAIAVGIIIGVLVVALFVMAISMAWVCFLGMPVKCGECKYFVSARNGDQNFGHLFDNFRNGNYKPTVKAMFYYYMEIFLWSLLFIIPGVIKSYEFALVPYLIAENPNLDIKRAKEISRQTMDGEKLNFWILQLSFIGWYLLGAMLCGIGVIFVQPYQQATEAEFYMCMRAKMLSFNYTTEEELTGGIYNGFGGNGGGASQYNEPDFRTNAYNVPNDPYQNGSNPTFTNSADPYQNTGYQNPNDQYGGVMPGVDLTKPSDDMNSIPTPGVDLTKPTDNNGLGNSGISDSFNNGFNTGSSINTGFNTNNDLNNNFNTDNTNNDFNNPYNQ